MIEIVAGDASLRAPWIQSYYISTRPGTVMLPATADGLAEVNTPNGHDSSYKLYIGPGSVLLDNGTVVSHAGGFVDPIGTSQTVQLFVSGITGLVEQRAVPASDNYQPSKFPENVLPLAVVSLDSVGRIMSIVDARPAHNNLQKPIEETLRLGSGLCKR